MGALWAVVDVAFAQFAPTSCIDAKGAVGRKIQGRAVAAASGRTCHLVSGAPVPVAALRTLALGYRHLHAPRFVPPETFERARLTRAEQTLDRRMTSFYASYLQRDPWFQDANLRALSGRACPRPDQAFLQRLIDYGIATGYLRGRTVQRTSG